MMFSELFLLYAEHGESLRHMGIGEAALPMDIAKNSIHLFGKNHLLLLGGDLYKKNDNGIFEFIYETWSYDKRNPKGSEAEALRYLSFFSGDKRNLFVTFAFEYIN